MKKQSKAGMFDSVVKMVLVLPTFHTRVPRFEFPIFSISRRQVMIQVLGSLTPKWEILIEFQCTGFGLSRVYIYIGWLRKTDSNLQTAL